MATWNVAMTDENKGAMPTHMLQSSFHAQWPDCSRMQWNRMLCTCYLLQWPVVYDKCIVQNCGNDKQVLEIENENDK